MYLKSIQVQGFKSFANKIVFEFHNGITGIVGPNGSGKSNVGDAVRWVLGEQSAKQLRGANMQDVIFSGTENRKALGYAFVAITLDNADHELAIEYDEVTVARKVYRSGESEYLINGAACRLKDVQELFYDTGIGKEGYSIIGQGQIDKILSGRPEERRELFDEAAGIVKFKKRKKAAQKNLENEQANLVRINDILSELEKQVGPLEKQAEKAKVFLKKKEELKMYDVNAFLLEIDRIKAQINEVEEKIRIVNGDYEETDAYYETTKAEYEELLRNTKEVENQIEEARNAWSQATVKSQSLEGEINVLKEQVRSIADAGQRIEDRKAAVLEDLQTRNTELEQFAKENKAVCEELDTMAKEKSEAKSGLEQVQNRMSEYSRKIEESKNNIIQMMNERAAAQGNQQRYDTMSEQVQIRKAQLNQRMITLRTNEAESRTAIADCEGELKTVSDQILSLLSEEKQLKEQHTQHLKACQDKEKELSELQNEYHKSQSKLESLINITERYDGYGNAIRRVMEQKDKNTGIIGVVADIIQVEKKYEVAVETALGASIQNIVTDTKQTAKSMIEYLKKNHFGRATFLPLDSIQAKGGSVKGEALKEKGVLGTADTLVSAEKGYQELCTYLLGKTLVADTMEHAIAIAGKYKYSIRIVTLEGELFNPGGSMTGGAFKNSNNLLGRRREIEELKRTTAQIQTKHKKGQEILEQLQKQASHIQAQMQDISEKIQNIYLLQNTVKMKLNQANEKKTEVEKEYQALRKEGEEMDSQIQAIGHQKKQINEEVIRLQNQVEELNKSIEVWQEKLEEEHVFEEKINSQVSKQQITQAGLQQKMDNIKQNQTRIEEEIQKLKAELEDLENQNAEVNEEAEEKEEQIVQKQEERADAEQRKKTKKELMQQLNDKKEAFVVNNSEFLDKREKLLQRKSDLDKERVRLQSQQEKLEEAHETSMNYMWEEYELTYNAALPLKNEQYANAGTLKQMIRQVRDEIRGLGDVNVNAIEDYKTVSERYGFLSGQQKDLLDAEQSLMQIIEELDEGMRRQFKEKFGQICVEFDKVYKELFGGGKGILELDAEMDILEAGIKIISQPPGKKLGNMMQLSGGEKALTAIALLFAIQNLKPSPFCLLDEIEAALDDSNVTRFAKYLHKLTKNTQFIIITHRRGTMAAADRLYGITMQEKGVSTLVSVDLIEIGDK